MAAVSIRMNRLVLVSAVVVSTRRELSPIPNITSPPVRSCNSSLVALLCVCYLQTLQQQKLHSELVEPDGVDEEDE